MPGAQETIYYQVGRVISGVMDNSETATTEHMDDRSSSNTAFWEMDLDKLKKDAEDLSKARQSAYYAFDEIRSGDHEEQLDDMLVNVISGVTAAVVTLIADDQTFDEQFQSDNQLRLKAWDSIANAIGSDGDINIV